MSPRHNSVLVTGAAESGKTAVIHEVIRRIVNKDCEEALHDREVWLITPDRIIAGAQFVGTWEERINNIVDECRKERHILYVPDLAGLLEVGRWSKSDANVAMALKPHIATGEVIDHRRNVRGPADDGRKRRAELHEPLPPGRGAGHVAKRRRSRC